MPPEHELIRQWLEKVVLDLRAAAVDLDAEPPLAEDAAFHCQQVFEKALKAFLLFQGVEFAKVHDLNYLLDLCIVVDASFERWRPWGKSLTVYAAAFRYPSTTFSPTAEQAQEFLDAALDVYQFTLDRLPGETHPGG